MTRRASSLVTAVVPTLDRPALLERALRSVASQSWPQLEILVIDDASREPVDRVAARATDGRARVIRHDATRGAAAARNTGIRAGQGDLIAFLDDDDEWLPDKIARQAERLLSAPSDTGLIYCGYETVIDRTGTVESTFAPGEPAIGFPQLLHSTFFPSSIPLCRRCCFENVGLFDENLRGAQDRDMWLRIAREFNFDFVPGVLARWHVHGRQITTDLPAKIDAKRRLLEKYRRDLTQLPSAHVRHLTRLAMLHFAAGQRRDGRRCLLKAARLAPTTPAYMHLLGSVLAGRLHKRFVAARLFRKVDGITMYY